MPTIALLGGEDSVEHSLRSVLTGAVAYLLDVAEAVVIHSVQSGLSGNLPFVVERIPDQDFDESRPIRHRLTIDLSAIGLEQA